MPPKKKKAGGKKKAKAAPIVIAVDTKLPALSEPRNTALLCTVANSDIRSLDRLVVHYDFGKVLSTVDVNGSTPIHIAAKKNDPKTLEKLLSYNAINIDAAELPCVGGYTAVHHASLNNYLKVLELLLDAGANPNIKCISSIGETALQLCCKMGHIECAKKLIAAGGNPELKDNFGNNASFWAHQHRQDRLIHELGLHSVKSATAEEMLAIMIKRNPNFKLPPIKAKKGKKGEKGKKKKK